MNVKSAPHQSEGVQEVVQSFGRGENAAKDTGSPEVQVAFLTKRINELAPHFEKNKHDYHSKRGLMLMIGKRRGLLRYLQNIDKTRYEETLKKLGLRK